MSRSKIRHVNPFEDSAFQFAGDLIVLAEALKAGFSGSSPLTSILEALLDFLLLALNMAEEGLLIKPGVVEGLQTDRSDFSSFTYHAKNGIETYVPSPLERKQMFSNDPLVYDTDFRGNPKIDVKKSRTTILFNESLEESLDFMLDLTSQLLAGNISPLKFVLSRREKPIQKPKKLKRSEYWYFRRKWDRHKRHQKSTKVLK